MRKIKFIQNTELRKVGDEALASKKSAESAVNNGYAVYIDEDKNPSDNNYKTATAELAQVANIPKETKKVLFNFESENPEKQIKSLNELEAVIKKYFPSIWFETKACLSAYASLVLENLNGCPSLILIGNPSGEKTTVLSFCYNSDLSYISDDFTPKAFVSHSTTVKKEQLGDIDLLPRIKNKVLITPELAPLFEAPKEDMLSSFSILTRILDGEGLNRDSGAHGHRGYSGDYKFVWLGASTPLRSNVWQIMGKMGNRLFFLNISDKNRDDKDYLEMFTSEEYEKKVKICRGAVKSYLDNFFINNKVRSYSWKSKDEFILPEIIKYAKLLSKLRGSLVSWKSEERGEYEHTFPIIEEPPRAINALRNFARGHALIHGRDHLITEDLEIVRRICLSSMPHDRSMILNLFTKYEGKLSSEIIEKELGCSNDTALRTLNTFAVLGVVDLKNLNIGYGRPVKYAELKPEFNQLLKNTHTRNNAENPFSGEKSGVIANPYDTYNSDLDQQPHPQNKAKNTFPQEKGSVSNG